MKKNICAVISVLLIFVFFTSTYAAPLQMPGIKDFVVLTSYVDEASRVTFTGNEMNFEADGSIEFKFNLPFDADSVTFSYTATEAANVEINAGSQTEIVALPVSDNTIKATFNKVLRMGDTAFYVHVDKAVLIKSITLHKVTVETTIYETILPNLSSNEELLISTVAMKQGSAAVLVNGGKRYVDASNVEETCLTVQGVTYLKAATLARALGYYYEDIPAKHYLMLRHDNVEFGFTKNYSYRENFNGYDESIKTEIANKVVYKNGCSYLPVRYFAEAIGKTVAYRQGVVLIDDAHSVQNILNDESAFSYVQSALEAFVPTGEVGKTYYVSQNHPLASDKNDGSYDAPFLTLAKGAEVAEAGDTVLIGEGVYREMLSPRNSGSPTRPIIFKAIEGQNVVISATEKVTGFQENNGIYTASVDWDLGKGKNQVFYQDNNQYKPLVEARYPNGPGPEAGDGQAPFENYWPVLGDLHLYTLEDTTAVTSETLLNQEVDDYWKGGIFVGQYGYVYFMGSAMITGSTKGKLTVEPQTATGFDNSASYKGWNNGYITGHINCLDAEEEWILQDGILHLIPPQNVTENFSVEVKKRPLVADLSNSKYVQLQGLTLFGGSMKMNNSEMCVMNDCDVLYNNHSVQPLNGTDEAAQGELGIFVGGTNNVFINNRFKGAAGAAIYGTGTYMYMENNLIEDCSYAGALAGVYFGGGGEENKGALRGGHSLYANTIARSGRNVLSHYGFSSNGGVNKVYSYLPEEIAFNDFHDGIISSLDAGITYEYLVNMGFEKLKSRYHNNYVYYTLKDTNPYSFGIYHDGATQFIDTYNNLIFTTSEGTRFWNSYIYTQTAAHAYSNCDVWNNSEIYAPVSGGADNLQVKDFPNEKPFYAGSYQGKNEYLVNYNNIVNQSANVGNTYYARNAVVSNEAIRNGGVVTLSDGEQWVRFDINCGESGANRFTLGFLGDKYKTGDTAQIIFGENINNGDVWDITLKARANTEEKINYQTLSTYMYKGNQKVWVRLTDYKSARIVSLKPQRCIYGPQELNADKIYGGQFTDYRAGNPAEPPSIGIASTGAKQPYAWRLWGGSMLAYEDVLFEDMVNKLTVSMSTDPIYDGQKVYVRLDSPTAIPIATYENIGEGFGVANEINVTLNSAIPAGKHDIYFTFDKGGTNNFRHFGFSK